MIGCKNKIEHQRKIEAGRIAKRIHDMVATHHAETSTTPMRIDPRSRVSRIRAVRRLSCAQGRYSLGAAHDQSCLQAFWAYLSTMKSSSLYKGIGVVANATRFEGDRTKAIEVESGLEALIDLHVIKRLALRAGARDIESQMLLLRPALAWCAAANQCGITGGFIVPTQQGMFFCRREALPSLEGHPAGDICARIVTFYGFDEMRKSKMSAWCRLRDAGILEATPAYPRIETAGQREMICLCAMVGEDLVLRTSTGKTRPAARKFATA